MQRDTRIKKCVAAFLCAAITSLLAAVVIAILLLPIMMEKLLPVSFKIFVGGYILVFAAIIIGILLALRQRIKEIKGGEEDVASQY